jgi:hypothetical protein
MHDVSAVDHGALPKREASELRLLWVNDWYDGPLEAVIEHAGERLLMVLESRNAADHDKPMRWILFRLTPEQWTEEERWHALFERHVGHHWCFHHDAAAEQPDLPESQDTKRFYEPYANRTPRVLDPASACGWVDEMPTR